MIEINDSSMSWHIYLFRWKEEHIEISSMYGGDKDEARGTINSLNDLPEDLRNVMLLCMTLPLTDNRTYTGTRYRGSPAHLAHYLDVHKEEVYEFNCDKPYTITDLLKSK